MPNGNRLYWKARSVCLELYILLWPLLQRTFDMHWPNLIWKKRQWCQREATGKNSSVFRMAVSWLVVIPLAGQKVVTDIIQGPTWNTTMKSKARSYVWWAAIDSHLEDRVKECGSQDMLWGWPQQPWSRIHVDYAGPLATVEDVLDCCGCSFQVDDEVAIVVKSATQ